MEWHTVDGLEKLTKKQLLEKLRGPSSAAGASSSPAGKFSAPIGQPPPAQKGWSLRKAEWVCNKCQTHNFVQRMDCRRCHQPFAKEMQLIAAGTPPAPRIRQALSAKPKATPPAGKPSHLPTSVQAAEEALAAAKQAAAPPDVVSQWESEIQRRKALLEETKVPPTLRSRLAQATADANSAMQAKERAEQALQLAKQALETARAQVGKAEEVLQQAVETEEQAAIHLRKVTAEVAPDSHALSADVHEEAKIVTKDLHSILSAFRKATTSGATQSAQEEAKATLEEALKAAASKDDLRNQEKETAKPAAAAKEASEARAMAVDRADASKRKGDEAAPTCTQPGNEDLDEDSLEQLLQGIPASKRQRAQERLTQMGVADAGATGVAGS